MQAHANFVFHLDEPREQFRAGPVRLRGWIATQEKLSDLQLLGRTKRMLKLEERPDVRTAFPNYAFASGFDDEVSLADLRDGALQFSFNAGASTNAAIEQLSAAPPKPRWAARVWAELERFVALLRLRFARTPASRWNAALSGLLLEIEIERGTSFRRDETDRLIALFAKIFPDAFVVQVGANDGMSGDPLAEGFSKTRWSGLLVEPVPHLYERLVAHYDNRAGIQIERAAVSTRDADAPLYRLRTVPGESPEWFNQLATLDRDVLLKHRSSVPHLDSLLIEERVPTVRLDTLLARRGISRIDLLVIDTEGHDLEVLRSLDFGRFRPRLLMFEHQHLPETDKQSAYALLTSAGYDFRETPEGDAIAWRKLKEPGR